MIIKRNIIQEKKRHTLKSEIIINSETKKIISVGIAPGKTHDFLLFKQNNSIFSDQQHFIADSGYEGLVQLFPNSFTPFKRNKKGELTEFQKIYNQELAKLRIPIEHVNRKLKRFRILSSIYRNKRRNFERKLILISCFYNMEVISMAA